jgi:hypothetical protein
MFLANLSFFASMPAVYYRIDEPQGRLD